MQHPYPIRAAGNTLPDVIVDRIRPAWNAWYAWYVRQRHRLRNPTLTFEYAGETHAIHATPAAATSFADATDDATAEGVPLSVLDTDAECIVDVGAYHGLYTTLLATINPGTPVLAYEPEPTNGEVLCAVVEKNGLGNVDVRPDVVAGEHGPVAFHTNPTGGQGNSIRADESLVETARIAIQLSEAIGDRTAFCKIDAEGAEHEILSDLATNTDAALAGIVEAHPDKLDRPMEDLTALLEEHFDARFLAESSPRHPDADAIDYEYNRPLYYFER